MIFGLNTLKCEIFHYKISFEASDSTSGSGIKFTRLQRNRMFRIQCLLIGGIPSSHLWSGQNLIPIQQSINTGDIMLIRSHLLWRTMNCFRHYHLSGRTSQGNSLVILGAHQICVVMCLVEYHSSQPYYSVTCMNAFSPHCNGRATV